MGTEISAIILSGGQGQRFSGQDKGLIRWQDQCLIEHVLENLHSQVDDIVISCNRNLERYAQFGHPLVADKQSEYLGPVAGISAAVGHIEQDYCLICPNDMPRLPRNLSERLLTALKKAQADVAYPICGQREHYLPALMKSSVLQSAIHYLANGGRSLKGWYQSKQVVTVDFTDQSTDFANINTPELLSAL